ncbi:MAG: phosphoribosylformylglycinamidine cyclo-ligase [Synergistaceae bacterium]|jgi:phosphoribosylformylglycinamidine cyclo-ligase|nr:phosphoribosylformylglycinamidine cyclo-ligase [Synergistaceae bacterium]
MNKKLSYEDSGVSISTGDAWVNVIKDLLKKRPKSENLLGTVGGFVGLYNIGAGQCIASCCDGVGTKLEFAKETDSYRQLGQDLVAMNVNDLVTIGARPLFFLDYIACGKLNINVLKEIVEGVLDACDESGCALLGGETAEMPGVYSQDGFDLAGFSVGLVDQDKIIDGEKIEKGNIIVGLSSSGAHSNGYSLIRTALGKNGLNVDLNTKPENWEETIGEAVMKPTKLYVRAASKVIKTGKIKGMAHITGGGMYSNIIRILPEGLDADIDFSSWKRPRIFDLIQSAGIDEDEMRKVFNLGIGYIFVLNIGDFDEIAEVLSKVGEKPIIIGKVVKK